MAKGKYAKWLTDDGLLLLSSFARDGLTDEEIADRMGISPATLYRWKNSHKVICEALKKNKEIYDNEVVESLHKKTLGYKVKVKKNMKVKKIEYDATTGKKILEEERIVTVQDEVYVPPDTMAQMYWLNNRMSDNWKARRNEETIPDRSGEEASLFKSLEAE